MLRFTGACDSYRCMFVRVPCMGTKRCCRAEEASTEDDGNGATKQCCNYRYSLAKSASVFRHWSGRNAKVLTFRHLPFVVVVLCNSIFLLLPFFLEEKR